MNGLKISVVVLSCILIPGISQGQEDEVTCILKGEVFLRDQIVKEKPDSCFLEGEVSGYFRCYSGRYIQPQCMCNYSQFVFRGDSNKGNGLCPSREDVEFGKISCRDCQIFSKEYNGPCGDRGNFTCESEKTVAADIKCKCKSGYRGDYCDYKKETMLCSLLPSNTTATCDVDDLKEGCITHNKNNNFFFNCSTFLDDAVVTDYKECSIYEPDEKPPTQLYSTSRCTSLHEQPQLLRFLLSWTALTILQI